MYMIIHKKDKKKMASMVEDILYTAGELMHCVEEMRDEEGYGDRYYGDRNYGDRYGMRDGGRYGNRDWDDDPMMERRRYRRY
jgi:hypothetical protein